MKRQLYYFIETYVFLHTREKNSIPASLTFWWKYSRFSVSTSLSLRTNTWPCNEAFVGSIEPSHDQCAPRDGRMVSTSNLFQACFPDATIYLYVDMEYYISIVWNNIYTFFIRTTRLKLVRSKTKLRTLWRRQVQK